MLPVYDNDCDTSTPLIHLETQIKNKFILKIYCILSLQLFITFLMSLGCYFTNSARQFVLQQQGVLISTILLSFLFKKKKKYINNICEGWKHYRRRRLV